MSCCGKTRLRSGMTRFMPPPQQRTCSSVVISGKEPVKSVCSSGELLKIYSTHQVHVSLYFFSHCILPIHQLCTLQERETFLCYELCNQLNTSSALLVTRVRRLTFWCKNFKGACERMLCNISALQKEVVIPGDTLCDEIEPPIGSFVMLSANGSMSNLSNNKQVMLAKQTMIFCSTCRMWCRLKKVKRYS